MSLRLGLSSSLLLLTLTLAPAAPSAAGPGLSEAGRWLQGYLRIDTTNPPGNEARAASYLAAILHREGIPTRLVVTARGRTSLWARLSSPTSGGRAVLLLHHMDVVAPGPDWTAAPFGGEVRDGRLWGRGAVDDKSLGIAQLAALIDLARRRLPLARDVVFLAVADEENGGLEGTGWLVERHPELFRGVEAVVGEGGRNQVDAEGGLLWWGIEVAQKRPLWLAVETSGRGGHGSGLNPGSANHQLVQGLARVLALPLRWRVTPEARTYVDALAPLQNEHWRRILARLDEVIGKEQGRGLMPGLANLFVDTIQVTVLEGGGRINVIPEVARAELDVRLLPDTDAQAFLAILRRTLGPDLRIATLLTAPPSPPSPPAGRLWEAFRHTFGQEAPVIPAMIPGFTDSRFFRAKGIPAYGISPFALGPDDLRGIHNSDERIPLEELDRGVERTVRLLRAYAAGR